MTRGMIGGTIFLISPKDISSGNRTIGLIKKEDFLLTLARPQLGWGPVVTNAEGM